MLGLCMRKYSLSLSFVVELEALYACDLQVFPPDASCTVHVERGYLAPGRLPVWNGAGLRDRRRALRCIKHGGPTNAEE